MYISKADSEIIKSQGVDEMKLYFELLKKPVFRIEDVCEYYNNINSARSAVGRLIRNGLVLKIRNNLYTCVNGETGLPVANRYQIASNVTETSYISHHTAMEYYGFTDQVFYDVYVSSETSFRDFEFDGYTYHCINSKSMDGVETIPYSGGIVITNIERTLIDSIKDMDKISGIEELIQNIGSMSHMQEKRLLWYLSVYQNQFLYQKTGFLLKDLSEQMNLSEEFFAICKNNIGKSKRYLTSDFKSGNYDCEWKLVIPEGIYNMKNGVINDVEI